MPLIVNIKLQVGTKGSEGGGLQACEDMEGSGRAVFPLYN